MSSKRIIYFNAKKITIRDYNTTMILNFIPLIIGCSMPLFNIISNCFNLKQTIIINIQLLILLTLCIYSYKHINNLMNIYNYKTILSEKEQKIDELTLLNKQKLQKAIDSNTDIINLYTNRIKQQIQLLHLTDNLKTILYLKLLLQMDDIDLLYLFKQKLCIFGYGIDDIKIELDMFNSHKLNQNKYFNVVLNIFIESDLKDNLTKRYLIDTCNNYLMLFHTEIKYCK